ncbi:AbrB family transcriptional regulator [Terrilactibacillus sp. BCM23-1]|uniref:AbrB family transcriptional regulator n=1 Tax=Terrilactibacillus tamarindi TaxID=2599694 RepID=A0A6N8CSR5_9BACI|nr:AbrB family transcriptional regulator [Terrilactibacillus tamarindi]MTT33229.1 AbrB family transcriptional regulator [Terrilactibacillus tamarindi]
MTNLTQLFHNLIFMLICSFGGLILALTGLSIGWMVGTLLLSALLSFLNPQWLRKLNHNQQSLLSGRWLLIGQCILGIQLGHQLNLTVLQTFKHNWFIVFLVLILSIILSLLSGFVLWKFAKTDLLTGLFGTTPGGLSAMSSIASEVGANPAIVSVIQSMRVILVVSTIPVLVSLLPVGLGSSAGVQTTQMTVINLEAFIWTAILVIVSYLCVTLGRHFHLPAPAILGSMIGAALIQVTGSSLMHHDLAIVWPHWLIILSQIFIGSSIGSKINKRMFQGITRVLIFGLIGSVGLILAMLLCAWIVSLLTSITFLTSILAFAPGGVAEMATTAVVLHADSAFVVGVQVIRMMTIFIIMPPLINFIGKSHVKRETRIHVN